MVDPISIASQAVGIAGLINQAWNLFKALKAAHSEWKAAARHVRSLAFTLEILQIDLLNNPRSTFNLSDSRNSSRRKHVENLIGYCGKDVQKLEALLKSYPSGLWPQLEWTRKGKQEVASALAGMDHWIQQLNLLLNAEKLISNGRLEIMMERLLQPQSNGQRPRIRRPGISRSNTLRQKKKSSAGFAILAALFISRLKSKVAQKRRRQRPAIIRRITGLKPARRVRTIPIDSKKKDSLIADYINSLAEDAKASPPASGTARLECWIVKEAGYAIGGRKLHDGAQKIPRGQAQLEDMVKLFQANEQGSTRRVEQNHAAVKWMLRYTKYHYPNYKFEYVAARIDSIDSSPHGVVRTKKVLVIVKRMQKQ